MSRRRIQQMRETGARRHGNDAGRDDVTSQRRVRSPDDVTDFCLFHASAMVKVGRSKSVSAKKKASKILAEFGTPVMYVWN